jgi:hypothetical protein
VIDKIAVSISRSFQSIAQPPDTRTHDPDYPPRPLITTNREAPLINTPPCRSPHHPGRRLVRVVTLVRVMTAIGTVD